MVKAILMCLALVAGGVLVTGCSDDSKKSESSGNQKCADCAKMGDGKMCDACQAKMWKDTCPECKKLGQGHMCGECQKKACENMK